MGRFNRECAVAAQGGEGTACKDAALFHVAFGERTECGLLRLEGGFTRVLLNQADTPERAQLGENMAAMLGCPVCIGSLQRGILKCLY